MLPLWANFPQDKNVFKTEDSFMIGNGLLVCPVMDADTNQISVSFPGENTVRKLDFDLLIRKQKTKHLK